MIPMTAAKKNDPASLGWVAHHSGYEYTRSGHIISNTLNWLQKKRVFVILLHKGYQSGGTIIIEANHEKVVVDKPKDWPATHTSFRVIFRSAAKLWSHFNGELLSASANSLVVKLPEELFILQRRQRYRINLPEGSMATFLYNHKKCKLNMQDLSSGGMLLCTKNPKDLPQLHHTIKNIIITLPSDDAAAGAENGLLRFKIKEGEIVRAFANSKLRLFCLGVQFTPNRPEEERIMKYIRQRELAQLRKGIEEQ
jgi:c-di-GMP-binding flagellar brake protein YcgR